MQSADYKRIGLIVATVICAMVAWAVARQALLVPFSSNGLVSVAFSVFVVVLLVSVAGIAFALLERRWDRWAVIFASWAVFPVFWAPDIWYASILPLFALSWYLGGRAIRANMDQRRKLDVGASVNAGMKFILLGVFLMLSLGFYLLPQSQETGLGDVSKGIQETVEIALQNPVVAGRLAELPPDVQRQFKSDLFSAVDSLVHQWLGPLGAFLPPILAFALFLALWGASFAFRWPARWLTGGIFWVLVKTGFVRIEEKSVPAEIIRI